MCFRDIILILCTNKHILRLLKTNIKLEFFIDNDDILQFKKKKEVHTKELIKTYNN